VLEGERAFPSLSRPRGPQIAANIPERDGDSLRGLGGAFETETTGEWGVLKIEGE
jgi:hypothetical protein